MKKLRKVFAVILSLAMVLGMSMTTFAAPALTSVPKGEVEVYNVHKGSEVMAYQIVKYDPTGKYVQADGTKPANLEVPTAEEIEKIAEGIAAKADEDGVTPNTAEKLYYQKVQLIGTEDSYKGSLDAGMWVVLVNSGGDKIYNPMIVSANVTTDGKVAGGKVNADGKFEEEGADGSKIAVYAKSSEAKVVKSVANDDKAYEIGDDIHFTVKADVPFYSESYKDVLYELSDTLSEGLEYNIDSVKVTVSKEEYNTTPVFAKNDEGKNTMTITIDSNTVKDSTNQGAEKVVVTYTAKLTEQAKATLNANVNPTTNKVELKYTNNPTNRDDWTTKDSETFHYTFGIDASIFGGNGSKHQNFIKTEEGKTELVDGEEVITRAPLEGAQFGIFVADDKAEDGYRLVESIRGLDIDRKQTTDGTTFSDADGLTQFVGLDANVQYYLREIAAPVGYSKVDTAVPVKVEAEFETNGMLKEWHIIVGSENLKQKTENVYTWDNVGSTTLLPAEELPYYFENTTLASLPSTGGIGTTIFTIGGCIIMVVAAGLFFASRRKSSK